ncbi:unnamed protein product, partial [Vitis vinifera]|uniref:Uncharacterized protein n=1 Tax=Vitis vinifera TaxID=29760 RepID=D7TLG5_VITVI
MKRSTRFFGLKSLGSSSSWISSRTTVDLLGGGGGGEEIELNWIIRGLL